MNYYYYYYYYYHHNYCLFLGNTVQLKIKPVPEQTYWAKLC
jgi:hypothetical protein